MLLNREWPWVQAYAEDGNIRKELCPCSAHWKDEQLSNNLNSCEVRIDNKSAKQDDLYLENATYAGDSDGGVPEVEELIQSGNDNGPNETEDP